MCIKIVFLLHKLSHMPFTWQIRRVGYHPNSQASVISDLVYITFFVEGTPFTLGSIAAACLNALPSALNIASIIWWVFLP